MLAITKPANRIRAFMIDPNSVGDLLRMIGQMVMEMLRRILNNRLSMMRFMLIDRYENRSGVMVRATSGIGAS